MVYEGVRETSSGSLGTRPSRPQTIFSLLKTDINQLALTGILFYPNGLSNTRKEHQKDFLATVDDLHFEVVYEFSTFSRCL